MIDHIYTLSCFADNKADTLTFFTYEHILKEYLYTITGYRIS